MAFNSKGTVNLVVLVGRIGQDVELKYTASGQAVCSISLATNTSYKGSDGNQVENTEWHKLVAWRKTAEIIAQYCKKGSKIYVEGKLATREWQDKDNVKRYTTEVNIEQVSFLDNAQGQGNATQPMPKESNDYPDDLGF